MLTRFGSQSSQTLTQAENAIWSVLIFGISRSKFLLRTREYWGQSWPNKAWKSYQCQKRVRRNVSIEDPACARWLHWLHLKSCWKCFVPFPSKETPPKSSLCDLVSWPIYVFCFPCALVWFWADWTEFRRNKILAPAARKIEEITAPKEALKKKLFVLIGLLGR